MNDGGAGGCSARARARVCGQNEYDFYVQFHLVILSSVIYSLLPRLMTAAASTRLSPRLVVVAGAPLSTNISFTLQSHIIQYRKVFVDIN